MHKIQTKQILNKSQIKNLDNVSTNFSSAIKYIKQSTSIDIKTDRSSLELYERDWSNMPGYADYLAFEVDED